MSIFEEYGAFKLREWICFQGEQILFFNSCPIFKRDFVPRNANRKSQLRRANRKIKDFCLPSEKKVLLKREQILSFYSRSLFRRVFMSMKANRKSQLRKANSN